MKALRASLIDLILRSFEVSDEAVAIAILVNGTGKHAKLADLVVFIVVEVTLSLHHLKGAGKKRPAPAAAIFVPDFNDSEHCAVLGGSEPLALVVGVGAEFGPTLSYGLELIGEFRPLVLCPLYSVPLSEAHKACIREIIDH